MGKQVNPMIQGNPALGYGQGMGGVGGEMGGDFGDQKPQGQNMMMGIPKPNPYVIVEMKDNEQNGKNDIVYRYPKSKIFVGGLDFKLTDEELKQHFSEYGEVEKADILKHINTGESRGFGFVTFKDEAVAIDLVENMRTMNINGR